jgi:predicted transcriptional regulator
MTTREDAIQALHTSVGTVDPAHAASEGYGKAIRAVQDVTKRQGIAMSAALDNNARLWEEYKRLKNIEKRCAALERENQRLIARDKELTEAFEKLAENGGDKYKTLYENTRKTLNLYLADAIDEAELEERRKGLDEQASRLDADGVAKAHVPDGGAIEEYATQQGLGDI